MPRRPPPPRPSDSDEPKRPRYIAFTADSTNLLPLSEVKQLAPPDQENGAMRRELEEQVAAAVGTLKPQEQKVLTLRFGLSGEEEHTLDEVGRALGVSRERIREVQSHALHKLRHPTISRTLKDHLLDSLI